MSATYPTHHRSDLPPRWLRLWCFFLAAVVPAGACVAAMVASLTALMPEPNFMSVGAWCTLLLIAAVFGCGMFLVLAVGIKACFRGDAGMATHISWVCGLFGGTILILSCTAGGNSQFRLTDWLAAFTSVYYLATTAILHARLAYLCRRFAA